MTRPHARPGKIPCWRCGQTMRRPDLDRLIDSAPCKDCRYTMVKTDNINRKHWSLPRTRETSIA